MEPQIILNAKVYPSLNDLAGMRSLVEACQTAADEAGTTIGLAPPQYFLGACAAHAEAAPRVALFGQHVDAIEPGSGTGWTTVEQLAGLGATGSLLNHAEHKIDHGVVGDSVGRLRHVGLQSLVCSDSDEETEALAPLRPTYLAVEPPELIGGDVSVTSADPRIVSGTAERVAKLSPATLTLCGAGVKTGKDVHAALELGAHGVLLASGVVKAADPLAALRDLCSGL